MTVATPVEDVLDEGECYKVKIKVNVTRSLRPTTYGIQGDPMKNVLAETPGTEYGKQGRA